MVNFEHPGLLDFMILDVYYSLPKDIFIFRSCLLFIVNHEQSYCGRHVFIGK